jgi:uncharacterized protein
MPTEKEFSFPGPASKAISMSKAMTCHRGAQAKPSPHSRAHCHLRSWQILGLVACLLILRLPAPAFAEKVQQLKARGYVNDFAAVLSAQAQQQLTAICTEVDQKAHAQIAVVTIHTLEGLEAAEFANELFQRWGVGHKNDNRGVLILLAVADHKYQIEVGYGLEPILPDGKVGGFGREMLPKLRANDYTGALLRVTSQIAEVIAGDREVILSSTPPEPTLPPPPSGTSPQSQPASRSNVSVLVLGFILLVVFLFLVYITRGQILLWLLLNTLLGSRGGGSWNGGGFGGSGGGGFGGFGGGASGGGGAGGSW